MDQNEHKTWCAWNATRLPGQLVCTHCNQPPVTNQGRPHLRRCRTTELPKLPSLVQQVGTYVQHTARWLARGLATVSQEEYAQRIAICQACPSGQNVTSPRGPRCADCGCIIATKAARRVESRGQSDCPRGHWPPLG